MLSLKRQHRSQKIRIFYFIWFFFAMIGLFLLILISIFLRILKRQRTIRINKRAAIKTPNLSAALSFACPGFGQIYNREIYRGAIYIILTFFLWFSFFYTFLLLEGIYQIVFAIPFILIIVFVYIDGIRDAYTTALAINKKFLHTKREKENDTETMMKMGRALYNNKNYEAAIDMCTNIISLNPTHPKTGLL